VVQERHDERGVKIGELEGNRRLSKLARGERDEERKLSR